MPPKNQAHASRAYAEAHDAHYSDKDLARALDLYVDILSGGPDTEDAKHSRTQIWNIVKVVVTEQTLIDAVVALAREHFAQTTEPEASTGQR